MYLLALFILQNFKKILRANPELRWCAIFEPKMTHLSWTKNFWYEPLLLLSSTYLPFSLSKIYKNSYSRSRVMRMCHFWIQNVPFAPNFFWKVINIIFIYLLALFIGQNFKKSFKRIQNYEEVEFLSPKWPISTNENFFQKIC